MVISKAEGRYMVDLKDLGESQMLFAIKKKVFYQVLLKMEVHDLYCDVWNMRGLLGVNQGALARNEYRRWKPGVCKGDRDSVQGICSNQASLTAGSCWNVCSLLFVFKREKNVSKGKEPIQECM